MTKRKGVKLIAPDRYGILSYQGDCKLIIDCVTSKMLKIEPKNKEFPDISVMFEWKWKFILKKNLMFVFAENNIQDFVLIFANDKITKKVHETIYRNREEVFVEQEKFQRLLIPIFQMISTQNNVSTEFKKVILKWIQKHEENEKNELLKLLKMHENNHQIMSVKNIKREPNIAIARKRRFSEMDNVEREEENSALINNGLNNVNRENYDEEVSSKKKKIALSAAKLIDGSKFEIVNFKSPNGIHRKLLVFTSAAKTHCYEYYFRKKKQNFNHRCYEGAKGFKAILKLDEERKECIKFEDKKHACSPIKYNPENYYEIKIIKRPNYEILDNCGTRSKRMLIIFDSNNRNFCYEYFWSSYKKFLCRGCALMKKHISAEIVHENTENEYIRLLHDDHICEIRKYNPEKFIQTKKFVFTPNFEIQTKFRDGKERKILIIFGKNDRNLCYTYYFETNTKIFYCNGCNQKGKTVSAKICKNSDGEEDCIQLSNVEHVCTLQKYVPRNEIFLRPPKFKFMESNGKYTSKIFIFEPNNPNLCYVFSQCSNENSKRYYCLGCVNSKTDKTSSSKNGLESKGTISVFLYKNENNGSNDGGLNDNDKYYVKMDVSQTHICKPQKYEPEKYEVTLLKPNEDYILFREKRKKKDYPDLAIYDSNDKTFCYKYYYHQSSKQFRCCECEKKSTAKLHQDFDGNEYIILNQNKHVCKPLKLSSIVKSDTVILYKSGLLFLKDAKKKKEKEFDKSQIIRKPNFELQRNAWGVPERKLIVFKNIDQKLCYEYGYNGQFRCNKCHITAKLHSENDEKYIVLSKDKHSCEPVKYQAEKTINESIEFVIFNRGDKNKPTKLIIFTSPKKDECYEYTLLPRDQYFRCCGCWTLKKTITAKVMKNSNGTEYVHLIKDDHLYSKEIHFGRISTKNNSRI